MMTCGLGDRHGLGGMHGGGGGSSSSSLSLALFSDLLRSSDLFWFSLGVSVVRPVMGSANNDCWW